MNGIGRVCYNAAGIPYILTGSFGSAILGTARTTDDLDLVVDPTVDLIIRTRRTFNTIEFERRQEKSFAGQQIVVTSPEDMIDAKPDWGNAGGSRRQCDDVAEILKARYDLNFECIFHWIRKLALQEQWAAACETAGIDPQTGRKDIVD